MKAKQVFNNAKWIIFCKIAQSLMQFIVGMLCARYLRPDNYGLINYAASLVAFALPVMKLGFDATLVRELVEKPHKEKEIMGTSLVLNIISGIICVGGVTFFASVMNSGDSTTIWVCFLYSFSIVCTALEMIQYWFQYKLISKYSSVVMLLAYVVVSAYKIILLITKQSVHWFAVANSLDYGLIGFTLIFLYLKKGSGFSFSFSRAKSMLSSSKHYIVAAMMLVIIQNTDHIMITNMDGKAENGFYSAAITCATAAQFVYLAIIDSFRPLILQNKKDNSPDYEKNVIRLYSITLFLALVQCVIMTVFAKFIVNILYGSDYSRTVPVLQILVWYFIFSVMGAVRNVWILAEEKQKYLWIINLSGALFNIGLNALLIPILGACGAAMASLATQFFANFVVGFILKPIRRNNVLILKSLNPVFLFSDMKNIVKTVLKKGKQT